MKKSLIVLLSSIIMLSTVTSQVLDKEQMKNTAWVGVGAPLGGDPMAYGFTDTFQTRFDRGKFTVEAMLNWSFLANYDNEYNVDNFQFGTSRRNPLNLKYGKYSVGNGVNTVSNVAQAAGREHLYVNFNNCANVSNTLQDPYYVNFLYHINKNVDFGVGTKLNWQVGPAPKYGSWLWEHDAHVRQGGFSTSYDDRSGSSADTSWENVGTYRYNVHADGNRPGTADVVGFVPFANKYAKRALGVRFLADNDQLEIGAALPNGFNTDDPVLNTGIKFVPAKWLLLAAAFEGLLDDGTNFYTGATIGFDKLTLDLYFAADSLFTSPDNDQAYGTGAALTFKIPNSSITLRPEFGANFFEDDNYTAALYSGIMFSMDVNKQLGFNIWSSIAFGSKDKRWDDYAETDDWDGGHVFDIRPEVTFAYTKNTSFAAYFDFEQRTAFDGKSRKCWATGLFWTYIF